MEGKTAFKLGKENIEGRSLLTGHSGIGPEIMGGIIDICGTGLPKTWRRTKLVTHFQNYLTLGAIRVTNDPQR